jgi:hypothetical protein
MIIVGSFIVALGTNKLFITVDYIKVMLKISFENGCVITFRTGVSMHGNSMVVKFVWLTGFVVTFHAT